MVSYKLEIEKKGDLTLTPVVLSPACGYYPALLLLRLVDAALRRNGAVKTPAYPTGVCNLPQGLKVATLESAPQIGLDVSDDEEGNDDDDPGYYSLPAAQDSMHILKMRQQEKKKRALHASLDNENAKILAPQWRLQVEKMLSAGKLKRPKLRETNPIRQRLVLLERSLPRLQEGLAAANAVKRHMKEPMEALDRIQRMENKLNKEFAHLREAFEAKKLTLDVLAVKYETLQTNVEALNVEWQTVQTDFDAQQQKIAAKQAEMTDSSSLTSVRSAIKMLNEELAQMDLVLGLKNTQLSRYLRSS
jgi:hypothetical protein